jgi:Ca2+:H+ antiporter
MKLTSRLPAWSTLAPIATCVVLALVLTGYRPTLPGLFEVLVVTALVGGIVAAVFHAEVVAHRVGEPYGTLVLALAVTAIEVALIVSLMIAGGEAASGLARDTVFASVMIILNGMVGICLLSGGRRHGEQSFGLFGISAALATLAAISVLTLVLPNYTTTTPGPVYSSSQLMFISIVSLVLYGTFVLIQTVRHRNYFLPVEAEADEAVHAQPPSNKTAILSAALLLACLGSVVLLAKTLSPTLEAVVADMGAPKTLVGIIIAAVVLLPESIAAYQAARANRLQTSLNLALGSALASIGLTIPAVAMVSLMNGWSLTLGIDAKSTVLLLLSLLVASLSLGTGRTTVMQGTVHLVIFAVYLFTAIVP